MRSFKTFLAEQQLPKLPNDPVARDVQARFQGMRQNVISGKPVYGTRGTGRSSSVPTPTGLSPAAAEVWRRQMSRGEGLASGEAISTIGPELLVPGGLATAPIRAALRGATSLAGKGAKNLPKAFNFPFNLLPKKYGERTAAKLATAPIAPVGGAAAVEPILDRDVNEYLQSAGYDPEVSVTPGQASRAYIELALKKPRSALSLATSKPAMKQYVGPGMVGMALGGLTRNTLAPIIAGTPPGVAARRAIVDPIATAAGVKDIQTGENPLAQDAARDYTNIIRRQADIQQKQIDATKAMVRARKEGMRQSMNPYYNPNRKKSEISTSAF
jgi:hypothetical protein